MGRVNHALRETGPEFEDFGTPLHAVETDLQPNPEYVANNLVLLKLPEKALSQALSKNQFVDWSVAKDQVPSVFTETYDDQKDMKVARRMKAHFNQDIGIQNRIDREIGKPEKLKLTESTGNTFKDFARKASSYDLIDPAEVNILSRNFKYGVVAFRTLEQGKTNENRDILLKIAREGAYSFSKLWHGNLRLPISYAFGRSKGIKHASQEDVLMGSYEGLNRAIEKFDEKRGFNFSTYAMSWVQQAADRALYHDGRMIHIPMNVQMHFSKLISANQALYSELRREPTHDELKAKTDLDSRFIEAFMAYKDNSIASLNSLVGENNDTQLQDLFEADDSVNEHMEGYSDKLYAQMLLSLNDLTDTEKLVLSLKHGVLIDFLVGAQMEVGPKKAPRYIDYVEAFAYFVDNNLFGNANAIYEFSGLASETIRHAEKTGLAKIRGVIGNDHERLLQNS